MGFDEGRCHWLSDRTGGQVIVIFIFGEEMSISGRIVYSFCLALLIIFESLEIGTEPSVVEWGTLYSCLLYAL